MGFGPDAGRRRQAAKVHTGRWHKCKCGREIMENAFYRHSAVYPAVRAPGGEERSPELGSGNIAVQNDTLPPVVTGGIP